MLFAGCGSTTTQTAVRTAAVPTRTVTVVKTKVKTVTNATPAPAAAPSVPAGKSSSSCSEQGLSKNGEVRCIIEKELASGSITGAGRVSLEREKEVLESGERYEREATP